ncbi:efflux transporter outer membrane subunit [Marinobacter sp. TBZ242]|uniref:Efflux transporter outer membrane subunit n=1 Tax=Marinobacter azerbaijanicus TaxID=3050455 RepID=A0ABT7IIE1_9GAMM|nr:efflux transporter outer membrane subunit [Marinobacter sp. TBZ242]MDL0433944.1 efflux transporter outer membrane subunit [Marinobacter sp. TBZ242]
MLDFFAVLFLTRCKSAGVVAALAALAGCTSLAPPHAPPDIDLPAAYRGVPVADTSQPPAARIAWRDYFTDVRLQALIERALADNHDLRSALLRVEEARAAHGIQRADRGPTIALGASGERTRVPGDLNLTGAPQTASQYQVGVGFTSWELDFWGRVRSLDEAALETYLATDEARRAAELSLIARIAEDYYRLRELDERLSLARRTVANREESLRIFNRRVEVGAAAALDLKQVEVLLHQARALDAQLELARTQQANALALLTGSFIEAPFPPERLVDVEAPGAPPPGLPSELLIHRPDIRAAEHALRSANANIGAARAAFFPRIALTGSAGTASAELDGLFGTGSRAWGFSPTLSLPIFDGGRRRASLDLAEIRHEQAVVEYERTIQEAFRDVADALAAQRWLAEQVEMAQAMLEVQRERARLADLRYERGAVTFLEVLDAQRDLLEAEQQWVQRRRELTSARIALYAALGGGERYIASALAPHPHTD